ncbi:MAG: thiamine-phosphate pyrophosphorylase [Candidatus Omnitrophica bacterium]|nr:thiamine-phosphate pyrophosphorylase [Candidatus Omnitrophota bacterium]
MKENDVLRTIDANLNRLREGLRVCEDVTRFILEDKDSTARLKDIRHDVFKAVSDSTKLAYSSLLSSRDSINDVGKESISLELKRRDPLDILNANFQRAKESVRVLEEFSKIVDADLAQRFKGIRFYIYNIEKVLIEKLQSTGNIR